MPKRFPGDFTEKTPLDGSERVPLEGLEYTTTGAIAALGGGGGGEKCAASIRASVAQSVSSGLAPSGPIVFDASDYTPRGGADAPVVDLGAHTITIKKAGLYRIMARVAYAPVAGAGNLGLILVVNAIDAAGLTDADIRANDMGEYVMARCVIERELDVDDVVRAYLFNTTGVNQVTTIGTAPYNAHVVPLLQVSEV